MNAAQALKAALQAHAPLTAIVEDRIYHRNVPDGVPLPAIAFLRASTAYVETIHGEPPASDVTFTLFCGDSSNDGADDIADAIEGAPGVHIIDRADDYDGETGISASIVTVMLLNQIP